MPKGSAALTSARREEIISACAALYETMSFKDITIKEIGNATSFTRTSIYNYFQTKEEIFLALLGREYEQWADDLNSLMAEQPALSAEGFASALAHSLEKRLRLLKLLSMNHYDMEENSRMEKLVEFKAAYGRALDTVDRCLCQYFPRMSAQERQDFLFTFFPFLFGVYPYTVVTDKQRQAMQQAGVHYAFLSVYELVYAEVCHLLR